jgi:hypothetical protein
VSKPKRVAVPQPVYVWTRTIEQQGRVTWYWRVEHEDKQKSTSYYQRDYSQYGSDYGYALTKGLAKVASQWAMNRMNRKFAYVTEVEVIEDA